MLFDIYKNEMVISLKSTRLRNKIYLMITLRIQNNDTKARKHAAQQIQFITF